MDKLPRDPFPTESCLRCGSARVASGLLGGAIVTPLGIDPPWTSASWWKPMHAPLDQDCRFCLACGLIWATIDTEAVAQIIITYGTEQLRRRVIDVSENCLSRPQPPPPTWITCLDRLIRPRSIRISYPARKSPEAPAPWWRFWKR